MEFKQSAEHVNWSPERKEAAIAGAAKLGAVQDRVLGSKWFPWAAVVVFLGVLGGLGTAIESVRL